MEPFYSSLGSLLGGCQGLAAGWGWEEILQIRGGGSYANEESLASTAREGASCPDADTWRWSDLSGYQGSWP